MPRTKEELLSDLALLQEHAQMPWCPHCDAYLEGLSGEDYTCDEGCLGKHFIAAFVNLQNHLESL